MSAVPVDAKAADMKSKSYIGGRVLKDEPEVLKLDAVFFWPADRLEGLQFFFEGSECILGYGRIDLVVRIHQNCGVE